MLLDYHSLYQPQPVQTPVWVPPSRVREPQRRIEPEAEPEPERQVVRASMDCQLPMVQAEIAATASTIPPTPVTEVDLDLQDFGIPEDELIMRMAAALLLRMREDDDD